jgi:malonyl-CoA/methylmalonyl-CoA synthetase
LTASPPTLVARVAAHAHGVALVTDEATVTYAELNRLSRRITRALLRLHNVGDLNGMRVGVFVPPGVDWVGLLLGIWRAGGVAVPLALSHPAPELDYVIQDSQAATVVADPAAAGVLEPIARRVGARFVTTAALTAPSGAEASERTGGDPFVAPERRALILYTSGTTGRPKGAVSTHANITAQIAALIQAWAWSPADRTLLVLPLHHVHGIINVIGCALWAGATCEIHERFDADATWSRLGSGQITVFTAVPTIYHRLIAAYDAAPDSVRRAWAAGGRRARLMMSGSAALPVSVLERWRDITGHVLLERYGMTEIGMALANPLDGERRPGRVGGPLPGVKVRLVDSAGRTVAAGTMGEIEVRGPGVFAEYWRLPDATRDAFRDGWFRTGDMALLDKGAYRILGRASVDIIKTGGYKVSALEIEDALRRHPAVADCAVVAVADAEWGERICAAIELAPGATLAQDELQAWAKGQLAPYKIPKVIRPVPALPRNAMGKVLKPEVAALFDARGDTRP